MFLLKFFTLGLVLLIFDPQTVSPRSHFSTLKCERPFSCGDIHIDIKHPFRLEGDPQGCGQPQFQLSCKHNRTLFFTGFKSKRYYLEQDSINYKNQTIRLLDPGIQKNNCSSLPLYSFPDNPSSFRLRGSQSLIFVSCKTPINSNLYLNASPCLTTKDFSDHWSNKSSSSDYSYVVVGKNLLVSDIRESCTIYRVITSRFPSIDVSIKRRNISYQDIHNAMAFGFELVWRPLSIDLTAILEIIGSRGGVLLSMVITARAIVGIILFSIFLIYKWQRRHLSIYDAIEEYLQSRNNLIPIRYSYKQIKKMTNNFNEKLGEGGYGSVYKGKLRSGQFVAIKMLSKSKSNGQEFINEVATLGRIHHVNVVRLVGFCATGTKRALVYDYMPNGSLDKFTFTASPNGIPMNWKKSFEIALGIARGIQYLHQGCNMQILHFDIKPHNILLDENFVPKVSDFGLAKLYSKQDDNIATLTAARGTLGYMAPELFYKKIGRVSHKADIYSFGMLLMEMAGRRRNLNAHAEHSSQIYYPSWIYDKFSQAEDIEFENVIEEEKEIARKLILVALWCIQMAPTNRPSMREVQQMLEGDLKDLQLPPKPLFYPPDSPILAQRTSYSSADESTEPLCNSVPFE